MHGRWHASDPGGLGGRASGVLPGVHRRVVFRCAPPNHKSLNMFWAVTLVLCRAVDFILESRELRSEGKRARGFFVRGRRVATEPGVLFRAGGAGDQPRRWLVPHRVRRDPLAVLDQRCAQTWASEAFCFVFLAAGSCTGECRGSS